MKIQGRLQTILQGILDSGDTWSLAPREEGREPGKTPAGESRDRRDCTGDPIGTPPALHAQIQVMRDRLIQAESMEEEESLQATDIEIVPAGDAVPVATERRSFTEDGMLTRRKDYLLQTAEGRLIESKSLPGGGKCSVCHGNSDRVYFCLVCRRSICFRHAHPWQEGHLCPSHYRQARFMEDTWAEDGKGQER